MTTTVPLKRIARLVYGDALASDVRIDGEVPVIGSGGQSGLHNAANAPGPTIVIGRKGSYGTIYWQPHDCFVIDTAYYVKPIVPDVDLRWLYYAIQAVDLKGVSQDVGVPGLSREDAHEVRIPVKYLDDQRRIANFLDAETARIDELVRLRDLQADRLAEALRNQAGRIIPDWQSLPLRRIVDSVQTGTTPTEILFPADPDNVPWYTPAALGGNLYLNSADKSVSKEDFPAVPRFPAESILIVGIGESLGKVGDLDHEATGNQQLTAIRISSSADRRFVLWRLFAAYDEIRAWAQYSRVRILNNEVLKSFRIPVPKLEEQIKIRQNLDHRLAEFTGFRDAAARFSQLAGERRRALITAAVTGGITV